ncbi:MAG: hypothetical protein M3Y30_04130 [Gemmatimonadota bacterium]|nr:hypothetical protein [Gemmatimonadota bacterium]
MTMTLATARLALSMIALAFVAPGPPIYPGAQRDTPQALIEKSTGVEASATFVTKDSFAQVDSFYRAHGAEDTAARRISASSKRALYYFADSKSDVLILWPKSGTSDQTSIVISKN